MSSSLRVKTRDLVAARGGPGCARRRASTRPPPGRILRERRVDVGARAAASIGCSGRPTSRRRRAERRGAVRRARPPRPRRRSPRSISARRTAAARHARRPARRRRPSRPRARPGAARRQQPRRGSAARPRRRARRTARASRRAALAPASPRPRSAPIRSNAASTSPTVSVGSAAGAGSVAQRRPADADLALAQLAGQERDARGYLVGRHARSARGEQRDLLAARGVAPDGTRGVDEVGQEHNPIVPEVLPLDTPSVCSVP